MSVYKIIILQFFLVSFSLFACNFNVSSLSTNTQNFLEWDNHRNLIEQISYYQAHGTFMCIFKNKKFYAHFNWCKTSEENYKLLVTNIFGGTEMYLEMKPKIIKLINNQGKCYFINNSSVMIIQEMGIPIPIHDLNQWMLGLPGHSKDFSIDSMGYLNELHYKYYDHHWDVKYLIYYKNNVPVLPAKIELRQDNNFIIFKIDSWKL